MEELNEPPEFSNSPPAESVPDESLSIDEFVRSCVRDALIRERCSDPFFADLAVFRGDAPSDLAGNHDYYLDDEPYEST
ncbi:MAG TPA: hypothetical protein VF175_15720 [Lacipirellula sp.]